MYQNIIDFEYSIKRIMVKKIVRSSYQAIFLEIVDKAHVRLQTQPLDTFVYCPWLFQAILESQVLPADIS